VRQVAFGRPAPVDLAAGERDAALAAGAAQAFRLPPGLKRIRLALPPQTAAVLRRSDETLATWWAERESRAITSELAADGIVFLNAGEDEVRVAAAWSPLGGEAARIAKGRPFKRYQPGAGTFALDVDGAGSVLRVHGGEATYVSSDGTLSRGSEIALRGAGRVLVDHGPGLVAAWVDEIAPAQDANVVAVDAPARVVPLAGPSMRVAVTPSTPVLLRVRTTVPVIATVKPPTGPVVTEVFGEGARLGRYLPAGRSHIELQPAGEGDLGGTAEIVQTPVVPIDEGLGEKLLLSGGEMRLFGFTLDGSQKVGVGLRASVDVADCRLYDASGRELGRGVVQMHDLAPGTFLLAVEVPPGSAPIEIQPALVGARPPDSGPPDDVKRRYLQLVGRLPAE
jgi:hypothetical protein